MVSNADSRACSRARVARREIVKAVGQKKGVLPRAPREAVRKNYRFFAAFFFEALAFFAIVFSSGLAAQPPTNRLVVTTGGLSHPPSYQM